MDEFVVESPADGAAPQMDPRRALLLPLWRGRYLILAATLLGIMGGVVYGVMRPNVYRSYGKLMIRAGQREELTPETSVMGGSGSGGGGGRSIVLDEIHLVSSPEVFEAVARSITPAVIFQPYDPSALDDESTPGYLALFHRWQSTWFQGASGPDSSSLKHSIDGCDQCVQAAAQVLAKNMSILPEPGSDVITITYPAQHPRLAQNVVAAFLEAAIAHHREVYDTKPTLKALDTNLQSAESAMTKADADFVNFQNECGVYDFEHEQPALLASIRELEAATAKDLVELEGLRTSYEQLTPVVAALPKTVEERTEHNMQPNPDRTALKQHVLQLEADLSAIESRVVGTIQERDAERQRLAQLIGSARAELEKQPEFVDAGPSVRTIPNPRRDRLQQQLDDARHQYTALAAAASVRAGQLSQMRARQQKMAECGDRFRSMMNTASDARRRYDEFRAKRAQAELMGSMDLLDISNLRTLQQATFPSEKEGPLRGKLVLIGILLGAVAGCALAFVRGMFDHRLHDATDVEQLLGTVVLGTVPQLRSGRAHASATRRAAL